MNEKMTNSEKIKTDEIIAEDQLFDLLKDKIDSVENGDGLKVISIVGGAASGKTTLAREFAKYLGNADTFSTDDYLIGDRAYRREHFEGRAPIMKYDRERLNTDIAKIKNLQEGEELPVPTYDGHSGKAIAADEYKHKIGMVDYLVIEGDFDFVDKPDLLVYFEVPDKVRLENRVTRDQVERNEVPEKITQNFMERQKDQHEPYTLPAKDKSDMVVEAKKDEDGKYKYKVSQGDM